MLFADGYEFVEKAQEPFDAIIVDLTDPFPSGPSLRLFTTEFYQAVRRILTEQGLMVTQSSSPLLLTDELLRVYANLKAVFPLVRVCLAPVPSYPGVLWSFTLASGGNDPLALDEAAVRQRLEARGISPATTVPRCISPASPCPRFWLTCWQSPSAFRTSRPLSPSLSDTCRPPLGQRRSVVRPGDLS